MTLVAAYKSTGIPILLGDFLISRGEDRHRGRKKICRIRDNLAVGWTGSLLQTEHVLAFDIWVMSAVGVSSPREELFEWLRAEQNLPMDLSADYHGGLLMFAAPSPCPPVPLVGCPWDDPGLFKGSRGRFEFKIPREAIEKAYCERQAMYAAAPYPMEGIRLEPPR